MKYKIGCDIGGTNIDVVLIDQYEKIIACKKILAEKPIIDTLINTLELLLREHHLLPESIEAIHIGSTIAVNALIEAKDLQRVGIIRLLGYGDQLLPPAIDWSLLQKNAMIAGHVCIAGGFECDGKIINKPKRVMVEDAVDQLIKCGAECFAIIGSFSPIYPEHELLVQQWIQQYVGFEYSTTLSKDLGSIGFLERENSTIINSALKNLFKKIFHRFSFFQIPIYFTQNFGALFDFEEALTFPIKTIAAGPSNSFIGAVHLAEIENAIVIDVGGTSSDCGMVHHQFPKRSYDLTEIAGIRLNFPMPEFISLPIGGGTIVYSNQQLGPQSISANFFNQASSFNGNVDTLTDAALALGYFSLPQQQIKIDKQLAKNAYQKAIERLQKATYVMRKQNQLPIICVGGGANLISPYLKKYVLVPEYFQVANAYGAAKAKSSVEIDQVICLNEKETAIKKIRQNAYDQLIKKGVNHNHIKIVHEVVLPFYYSSNYLARVNLIAQG